MRFRSKALALGLALMATAVMAKQGVVNPVVKDRQAAMSMIAANVKVLGDMAGGKRAFDEAAATEAAGAITGTAVNVADLFRPQESDPASDAKPEIWADFTDFETKAEALFQASLALDASSAEGVQAGMAALGGACKDCHSKFRM